MMKLFSIFKRNKPQPEVLDPSKFIKIKDISFICYEKAGITGRADITIDRNSHVFFDRVLRHTTKPIVCRTIYYHANRDIDQLLEWQKRTEDQHFIDKLEGEIREIEIGDIFEIAETHDEYKGNHNQEVN